MLTCLAATAAKLALHKLVCPAKWQVLFRHYMANSYNSSHIKLPAMTTLSLRPRQRYILGFMIFIPTFYMVECIDV